MQCERGAVLHMLLLRSYGCWHVQVSVSSKQGRRGGGAGRQGTREQDSRGGGSSIAGQQDREA